MKSISNRFFINYMLMFFISILVTIITIMAISFSQHVISENLVKNIYKAEDLMKDDYNKIDAKGVLKNGGGVQVIDSEYKVVISKGLDTIKKDRLTVEEFTDFLISSRSLGVKYSYDIKYNTREKFWLLVTFPTSIRINLDIVHNEKYESADMKNLSGVLISFIIFYLLMLAVITAIYSRITSMSIVNPLKKFISSVHRFKDGDYSARVELKLNNEFGELQDTFNAMAQKIENEISLRMQSEETRKKLVLDLSHDLKNPLTSIMGYAELCMKKTDLSREEREAYNKIIYENSIRANNLIADMFELSKMDSSEYRLNKAGADLCEFVRGEMGSAVPVLEKAGFIYDFDIPEEGIIVMFDASQMSRVCQNLVSNVVKFNPQGTVVSVKVFEEGNDAVLIFRDNGTGIPRDIAKNIFLPFVRADLARNSETGGTGLGLAIVEKIISAHGGSINLHTDKGCGCKFEIRIPKVK